MNLSHPFLSYLLLSRKTHSLLPSRTSYSTPKISHNSKGKRRNLVSQRLYRLATPSKLALSVRSAFPPSGLGRGRTRGRKKWQPPSVVQTTPRTTWTPCRKSYVPYLETRQAGVQRRARPRRTVSTTSVSEYSWLVVLTYTLILSSCDLPPSARRARRLAKQTKSIVFITILKFMRRLLTTRTALQSQASSACFYARWPAS